VTAQTSVIQGMKKPGAIACLALAIALVAPPLAEGASPVRGAWTGQETRWWAGSSWKTTQTSPVAFRLERGRIAGFSTGGANLVRGCADGQSVTTALPAVRTAKVIRSGRTWRFSGVQTDYVDSRKMTTSVSGRFTSARRARGTAVSKVQGCKTYISVWKAEATQRRRPGGGRIHIPICRGRNVLLPDGSYYYNPCAYVAGRPKRLPQS
jgi:hypothetical protein